MDLQTARENTVTSIVKEDNIDTCVVDHLDATLFDFRFDKIQLPFHLLASPDLIDKLPLEDVDVRIEVAELDETQLADLSDALVGGLRL